MNMQYKNFGFCYTDKIRPDVPISTHLLAKEDRYDLKEVKLSQK